VTSTPPRSAAPAVGRTRVVNFPTVVVFPAGVGPEETEDLARLDRKGDAVDGVDRRLRIALDQLDDFDCGLGRHAERW
jgi:hypothetical protein